MVELLVLLSAEYIDHELIQFTVKHFSIDYPKELLRRPNYMPLRETLQICMERGRLLKSS